MEKKLINAVKAIFPYLSTLLIFLVVFKVILFHGWVPSASMEPTIMPGSLIFGEKVSVVLNKEIKRNEIVIFTNELEFKEPLIKRVIAVEGDKVKLEQRHIYLNDELLDEPYVSSESYLEETSEFIVPKGHIFLAGDNRDNSIDGRHWKVKTIPVENVTAKALLNYSISLKKPFIKLIK